MAFSINIRHSEPVTILDLNGNLTIGEPVAALRDAIQRQLREGRNKLILNLGDVSYIDSSGLGELVWAFTSLRNQGGDVKLLNLTTKVKDLLQLTKLLTVFDSYDSESRAIGALAGWP